MTDLRDRYIGALLGLACGDAVGTTEAYTAGNGSLMRRAHAGQPCLNPSGTC